MHKIVKIILVVLGVIGAVLWFQLPGGDVPPGEAAQSTAMNFMFIITYILLGIAIVVSLFYALMHLFSSPQSIKKAIFILIGLVVVVGISYVLSDGADGTAEEMTRRGVATTESTVKKIGMGLNVFFILTVVAVGAMLWGGVKKMTNR